MPSPKIEVFVIYDSAGEPLTGLTPAFVTYTDDDGGPVTPPVISEIGGGAYKFTPVFTDLNHGIVYVIACGVDSNPKYYTRYMRPEDWATDHLDADVSTLITPYVSFTSGGETIKPIIFSVVAPQRNQVIVTFSEPVVMTTGSNGALNPGNYGIEGLAITAVTSKGDRTVLLTTSNQAAGVNYTLAVSNIEDLNGNVVG